jgi:hypothetical protein
MYRIIECEQGSDEWFQARLGKLTASVFDKITTKTGKLSASSEELINRAVAEILLGEPDETFQSDAMLRGKELESEALEFFNFAYDHNFEPCGFLESIKGGFGCSPDALDLENEIGLELKCPLPHNHLSYLSSGKLPQKYFQQVQGSMLVTGFKKWIFGSYHPEIRGLHVVVERDEKFISQLEENLIFCSDEIKKRLEKLNSIDAMGVS